jgi:hypothetical protein
MTDSADLNEVIRTSSVVVRRGRYAYLKAGSETDLADHFLIARDQDETTVVTEEANLPETSFEEDVKWFKLIEIRVSQPFVAKGFIARVTQAIAERDLNVLVVSTFSKDYFLVREETSETAIAALQDLGFPITIEES